MKKLSTIFAISMLLLLMFSSVLAQEAASTQSVKARAMKDGWPDTPAALTGYGWVDAFNTGEEAMHKFLADNLTQESLAERSMTTRMASYKSLFKKYGILTFIDSVESKRSELTATIIAEDTSRHRFIFRVERDRPHKLKMVGIVQSGHGSGGH